MMTNEEQYRLAAASPDRMFINGVCSDEVGLYVDTPPMPPMPEEKVIIDDYPTGNGSIYKRTGLYEDVTINVRCFVFNGGYNPGRIYGYIQSTKTLSFGRTMDYYYKVKRVQGIVPQYQREGKNFLSISFVCEPFRYRTQNTPVNLTDTPSYITNITNVYHEPKYKLYIADEAYVADFTVNGITLQIAALALDTGVIVIDLQRKKIYKEETNGDLVIVQEYTSGEFWKMVLKPGQNIITWQSGISKVEVTVNERWL